jgi:hypothetical protein
MGFAWQRGLASGCWEQWGGDYGPAAGDAPVGEIWSGYANAVIQAGNWLGESVAEWRRMGRGHTGSVPCREGSARVVASFRKWAS